MSNSGRQDPSKQSIPGQHSFALEKSQSQDPQRFLSSARSYADLNYLFATQDTTMLGQGPKPKPTRRKSTDGETTKHRRTRSGCYTCRKCVYPDTQASGKSGSGSSGKGGKQKPHQSPGSSEDEEDELNVERLETIPDDDEHGGEAEPSNDAWRQNYRGEDINVQSSREHQSITRQSSETPSLVHDKGSSPTPSTEGSIGYPSLRTVHSSLFQEQSFGPNSSSDILRNDWSHLPPDLQFYLAYFDQNITFLHYNIKSDPNNLMRPLIIDAALRTESLLYAVVGFSAFQHAVERREGKIQDFLQYYNKAVSLLLRSLKAGAQANLGALMTILQLATIEEYLGDWANLLGHQKAAHELLIHLYNPHSILETELGRIILSWYVRFDVSVGLMGGFDALLPREWVTVLHDWCERQIAKDPTNLVWKYEHQIAKTRILGNNITTLFAKKVRGEITHEQYLIENAEIMSTIRRWKDDMHPSLLDSRYLVMEFPDAPQDHRPQIFDPYTPGILYSGPLWLTNACLLDWYAIDIIYGLQTAQAMQTAPDAEHLARVSQMSCQLYESTLHSKETPKGAVVGLQGALGVSAFFLPQDETHFMWIRRKLAMVETHGFFQPRSFRERMAEGLRDNSCMHWWLPNDELFYPLIRSIRNFVDDRTSAPKNVESKDVQDMKIVFSALSLSDESDGSPPVTYKGKGPGKRHGREVAVANRPGWSPVQGSTGYDQPDAYGNAPGSEQAHWNERPGGYR
ncbi:C6 finger domain-containing protein [Rutstroemia sp. NJR-2017a BBW]|nr:C6 finger domain-containing protein [Rutstroemia sp. NJR-2017a BBW]